MRIRTPYFIASLCMLAAAGCVERRMTIATEPTGARVYLDGDLLGTSPVTASFTFYGYREIRVKMTGYDTLVRIERFAAPVYQWFPLDLVSEVFIPWTITDERHLAYRLEEAQELDKEGKKALIARADAFRAEQIEYIARQREERRSAEMQQLQAELRQREEQGLKREKWYRIFF